MMNDRNEQPNQTDEGDLLTDEVSDEAVEAAASVATRGLPTFGIALIASVALLGRRSATKLLSKDEARRIAASIAKLPDLLRQKDGP